MVGVPGRRRADALAFRNLRMLPLVMLVLLISKVVADAFNANVYDLLVRLKGFPHLEGYADHT